MTNPVMPPEKPEKKGLLEGALDRINNLGLFGKIVFGAGFGAAICVGFGLAVELISSLYHKRPFQYRGMENDVIFGLSAGGVIGGMNHNTDQKERIKKLEIENVVLSTQLQHNQMHTQAHENAMANQQSFVDRVTTQNTLGITAPPPTF